MPDTPRLTKSSTTEICASRSSSFSGPFQRISTVSSLEALTAPAWIDFQNSCVVPFGMTAMTGRFDDDEEPFPPQPDIPVTRVEYHERCCESVHRIPPEVLLK